MKQGINDQRSGNVCVSCLVLHIAIVIVLVIGFDAWLIFKIWG